MKPPVAIDCGVGYSRTRLLDESATKTSPAPSSVTPSGWQSTNPLGAIPLAAVPPQMPVAKLPFWPKTRSAVTSPTPASAIGRCQRLIEFEHAAVADVGYVQVARAVEGDTVQVADAVGTRRRIFAIAVIASGVGEIGSARTLAEDKVGGLDQFSAPPSLLKFEHTMVAVVTDVQISRSVDGD